MNNPSTITPQAVAKQRDSNMELLRILAMVLVMVVHANFRALPVPSDDTGKCATWSAPGTGSARKLA